MLRRTAPETIEPLFHSKYPLMKSKINSWFLDSSHQSLYQYTTVTGSIITSMLEYGTDPNSALVKFKYFRFVVTTVLLTALSYFLRLDYPIKFVTFRILTSRIFWAKHNVWSRIMYAPLPLKLYLAQLAFGLYWSLEKKVFEWIRSKMVEYEANEIVKNVPVNWGEDGDVDGEDGDVDGDDDVSD